MIRPTVPADTPFLVDLAQKTGVFKPLEIEALKEVLDDFHGFNQDEGHQSITYEHEGKPIGFAYYAQAQMAEHTWYLYWIAVSKDIQAKGIGGALLKYVEEDIRYKKHGRVLFIETSSLPHYDLTRRFYKKCNYEQAAVLADYYSDGDDMVIFRKRMALIPMRVRGPFVFLPFNRDPDPGIIQARCQDPEDCAMASRSREGTAPRSRKAKKSVPARNGPAQAARRDKWLPGIPEWEAAKSNRRNLSHSEAVRECAFLTTQYRRMSSTMASVLIDLDRILKTLTAKKIPFMLTGAHGISSWTGRPRATHDVDLLVKSGRNYARAVAVIRELYPQLEHRRFAGLTAFFPPGERESVIDVSYPHRPDNAEALRTALWVEERNQRYRIPRLEAALANKYGAMLTPTRDAGKRGMDAVDFYNMVKHSLDEGRQPINVGTLEALGEMVWPGGGGKEILRLVDEVKAGKVPSLLS